MNIKFTPGMICGFEENGAGGITFCIYPDKSFLQINDRRKRIEARIAALEFSDLQSFYQFFAVNFQAADKLIDNCLAEDAATVH